MRMWHHVQLAVLAVLKEEFAQRLHYFCANFALNCRP